MIEHVLDLGNQLKKDLETSNDFEVDSYKDLLIIGMGGYSSFAVCLSLSFLSFSILMIFSWFLFLT